MSTLSRGCYLPHPTPTTSFHASKNHCQTFSHHWLTPLAYKEMLADPVSLPSAVKPTLLLDTNSDGSDRKPHRTLAGRTADHSKCKCGRSVILHTLLDVLLKLMWWWLLCFSFNTETLLEILDVPFPPAPPTSENLDDICCQAHGRLRYPDSFFPRSGRSYLRRRGKAINRLESWYAFCCSDQLAKHSDFLVLCCAQQAVSVRLCCCVLETEATIIKIVTGKY